MSPRRPFGVGIFIYAVLILTACGTAVPKGAYRADPSSPQYQRLARSLYRAGGAAGEKAERYKLGMIRSWEINAANAGAGVFYFTDGLASQPQEIIDGVIAHEVAHEALGHVGKSIVISVAISTVFAVLDAKVPGLRYGDELVNPLVVRAFGRSQELEADQKGVEILRKMGYSDPERVMLQVLTLLRDRYGRTGGGLLATHPNIEDRISEIAKLQPAAPAATAVVQVPPPPKVLALQPGGRVVVLTLSGLDYSGTLEKAGRGVYLVRTADRTVSVPHADLAELRHYHHLTPEDRERLRRMPLWRLRRVGGWESLGWVKAHDEEMYEMVLSHDESTLFIRNSRVGSIVREDTPP